MNAIETGTEKGPNKTTTNREQARANETRIDQAWHGRNRSSMLFGWLGAEMRKKNQFAELGYTTEQEFWMRKGYARTTWFDTVSIAVALQPAKEEDFVTLTLENARMLAKLPAEHRHDPELWAAARTETAAQFSDRIDYFNGDKAGTPREEVKLTTKFRMTQTQRSAVHDGLEEWMKEHNVKDEGEALELLVAEYTGRLTLVGYYKETIERLTREAAECGDAKVKETLMEIVWEMRFALDTVVGDKVHYGAPVSVELAAVPELVAA